MLGRLLKCVAVSSLLLCAALCALWARSCTAHDQVSRADSRGRLWWLDSEQGRVEIVLVNNWPVSEPLQHVSHAAGIRSPTGRRYESALTLIKRSRLGTDMVEGSTQILVMCNGPPFLTDDEVASWAAAAPLQYFRLDVNGESGWQGTSDGTGHFFLEGPSRPLRALSFPYALPVAVSATLPVGMAFLRAACRALARRRHARPGLCPACGYDLTANISGVCPECGCGSDATIVPPARLRHSLPGPSPYADSPATGPEALARGCLAASARSFGSCSRAAARGRRPVRSTSVPTRSACTSTACTASSASAAQPSCTPP